MCPRATARNADGGEERERERPPHRAGPAPHRPGRRGARTPQSLLSGVFRTRVQGRGWPEPDFAPGPAAVPPGPTLSASASARGRSPGPSASSEPSGKRASGEGQPPPPAPRRLPPRTPPTSSSRRFSLSFFTSSQMSVSFFLRTRGDPGEGVGRASLEPAPLASLHLSPLTPAAPPSAPGTSLKPPPGPLSSKCRLRHFCGL